MQKGDVGTRHTTTGAGDRCQPLDWAGNAEKVVHEKNEKEKKTGE